MINDLQAAASRGAKRYGDIAGHIAAAFRDHAVGAFLTISEIAKSESDIYPDGPPSQGAIAARLFPSSVRCTVPGVRPAIGPTGVRGAYKT